LKLLQQQPSKQPQLSCELRVTTIKTVFKHLPSLRVTIIKTTFQHLPSHLWLLLDAQQCRWPNNGSWVNYDNILEFGLGINLIPQNQLVWWSLPKLTKLCFTSSEVFYTSKCFYTGDESHNVFPVKWKFHFLHVYKIPILTRKLKNDPG